MYLTSIDRSLTEFTNKQAKASLRGLGFGSGELIRRNLDTALDFIVIRKKGNDEDTLSLLRTPVTG